MEEKKLFRMFEIFLFILVLAVMIPKVSYGKQTKWKCFLGAPGTWETGAWPQLAEDIYKGTEGQLKIDVFQFGEHPYKGGDLLKAVKEGEADIVQVGSGWVAGLEPRLSVQDMPLLIPPGDFKLTRKIYKEFQEKYLNKVLAEWNCKVLLVNFWGEMDFFLKDVWIEGKDSLKGKRVRAYSPDVGDFISMMGGIPVMMPFGDCYTALQTGLLDGVTCGANGAYGSSLTEVVKNINTIGFAHTSSPFVVNVDALDALSDEVRSKLLKVIEEKRNWFETGGTMQNAVDLRNCLEKHYATARPVPKSLREQLRNSAYQGIWSKWIDRAGPKGKNGFVALVKILNENGIEVPGFKQ